MRVTSSRSRPVGAALPWASLPDPKTEGRKPAPTPWLMLATSRSSVGVAAKSASTSSWSGDRIEEVSQPFDGQVQERAPFEVSGVEPIADARGRERALAKDAGQARRVRRGERNGRALHDDDDVLQVAEVLAVALVQRGIGPMGRKQVELGRVQREGVPRIAAADRGEDDAQDDRQRGAGAADPHHALHESRRQREWARLRVTFRHWAIALRSVPRRRRGRRELVLLGLQPRHQVRVRGVPDDPVELGPVVRHETDAVDAEVVDPPAVADVVHRVVERHLHVAGEEERRPHDRVAAIHRLATKDRLLRAVLVDLGEVRALDQLGEEAGEVLALRRRSLRPSAAPACASTSPRSRRSRRRSG